MRAARVMLKYFDTSLGTFTALFTATLFLLSGCRSEAAKQTGVRPSGASQAPAQAAATPEAHILIDEAMLRKPHAVLGGTVENVGGERLENLSVELELRRRAGGGVEVRTVPVQPSALAPGEKGRYSLRVLSDEWGGSRLLRLRSGSRQQDVAFKSSPGARRPPERLPESRTITVTKGSRPKSGGEEFINTPDTPIAVP